MTVVFRENEIFDACRVLFGPEIRLSSEFLGYLQASGARSAYRRRAKEVHPDLVHGEDEQRRKEHARLFNQLAEAFDLVTGFLESRTVAPAKPTPRSAEPPPRKKSSPQAEFRQGNPGCGYYRGRIPARPMEIGLYLYYRGAVNYRELMEALLWQRKQRPTVGSIARRWGWLDKEDVMRVLRVTIAGRFGDRAVAMELLTPFQVQTLLYFQRCQQQRLGDYFVENKILTTAQMDRLVTQLVDHNRHFGVYTPRARRYRAAV